jgi:hypothetical protein
VKDKHSDRSDAVDRLLAATLKARAEAVPDAVCLDTETLAAWADGALDASERFGVEAHAADCAHCQALLAAMVKTTPAPSAAASPFRLRSRWWLIAMTPAAAALVLWFAVPRRVPVPQSQSASAVDQVTPALSPAAEPAPPTDVTADTRAKVQAEPPPPSPLAKGRITEAPEKKMAPAAPERADAVADAETRNAAAAASAVAPAAPPPAPSADASLRREPASVAERRSAFANPLDRVVVSSNPATRFRLLTGGGVQRSADAGATWRIETTGATDTLTAGASPSPSVCWLIGRSGTVLLSTDGRSWRRLAFPEDVDLRSISATDRDNATVTAVDGRVFTTTDGGQTWRVPAP